MPHEIVVYKSILFLRPKQRPFYAENYAGIVRQPLVGILVMITCNAKAKSFTSCVCSVCHLIPTWISYFIMFYTTHFLSSNLCPLPCFMKRTLSHQGDLTVIYIDFC